jgi:ribosomal protein S18 acetylase RimI-like enzyme
MIMFTNIQISIAAPADAPLLKALLDSAYRGKSAQQGWTAEANIIAGDTRIDIPALLKVMAQENSVMLKYVNEDGMIIGCVNLQQHNDKVYLGMLAVNPTLQAKGTGKQLLSAAEEWSISKKCHIIYMSVITLRTELIDWYKRHGYVDTGERKPFVEDGVSGKHLQPLEFMMLEKTLLL